MTFKREMEKAVKSVLAPLGYKYKAKEYAHIKPISDDITHLIRYADENHFRPRYFYLKIAVQVISKSLNEILYEVTDGLVDLRNEYVGPVFQMKKEDNDFIFSEFFGNRAMEENISDLEKVYDSIIVHIFERYTTQKSIYTCAIHDEMAVKDNVLVGSSYVPLAYYFEGEFDKAFEFIDNYIAKQMRAKADIPKFAHVFDERVVKFEAIKKNLHAWIKEKRTFKVDSEYMPKFE